MAKKKADTAATAADGAVASADGAVEQPKKQKKERLFTSTLDFGDIRKKEGQLIGKFNRAGRAIKGLNLGETETNQILEILKTGLAAKGKELTGGVTFPAATPAAEAPAAEAMV